MTGFRFSRPSPALIVAIVALIVALGGTSYAALYLPSNVVGTSQLKKGAVTTRKIKNGAVTGNKVAANTITGGNIQLSTLGTVPSATSATSATTANGLDGVQIVAGPTVSTSSTQGQGTAACPSGMQAIGGDAVLDSSNTYVDNVGIQSSGATDNQVSVEVTNPNQPSSISFNAYAVCINGSVSGSDEAPQRAR
jgi:hypothetical protein